MRCILTLAVAVVALAGCKPQEDVLRTWLGAPGDKLVSIWGAPTETFTTEDGVQVLVYSKGAGNDVIIPAGGQRGAVATDACETTFILDGGHVVSYTRGGGGC